VRVNLPWANPSAAPSRSAPAARAFLRRLTKPFKQGLHVHAPFALTAQAVGYGAVPRRNRMGLSAANSLPDRGLGRGRPAGFRQHPEKPLK
jgi:hypothetical protein